MLFAMLRQSKTWKIGIISLDEIQDLDKNIVFKEWVSVDRAELITCQLAVSEYVTISAGAESNGTDATVCLLKETKEITGNMISIGTARF